MTEQNEAEEVDALTFVKGAQHPPEEKRLSYLDRPVPTVRDVLLAFTIIALWSFVMGLFIAAILMGGF